MGKYISKTIIIALILCSVCFVTYKFYDVSNVENTSTKNIKQNNNMLSMMLETEAKSGQYEMTTSSTWSTDGYIFNSELSKCENGGTLSWDDINKKVVFEGNNIDKCYVYFDIKLKYHESCNDNTLSCYVAKKYTGTQGENNVYYHDSILTNGAEDNSYRFAGANPNNYVCFGSDDTTCPTENLYRIIGVIDGKVKLISADGGTTDMLGTDGGYKNTYSGTALSSNYYKGTGDLSKIGVYAWNSKSVNSWIDCIINITNLNSNFLTYLDNKNVKWKNMIADTTWYVGGVSDDNARNSNAKTTYNYETGLNKDTTSVTSKVGLMYLSDYYYSAKYDHWTLPGVDLMGGNDYSKAADDNWMYIGLEEWTISRITDYSSNAFGIFDAGNIGGFTVNGYEAARPTFNLISSVTYVSGTGTSTDPIRVKI